ncbi:MAG TPA: IPT/TIG domain-containing protein [Kofleriaceae bacterium]
MLVLLVGLGGAVATACSNDNPKLMVTGIEPNVGDPEGTYVRIRGNRFTADGPRNVKVFFGGREGAVSRFESDSVLVVSAPGGKPNEVVDVLIVFDPGGQLKIPGGFRYREHAGGPATVDDLTGAKAGSAKK